MVGFSFLILVLPIVDEIQNILQLRFQGTPLLLFDVVVIATVYILYKLILVWFDGAVINMLKWGQDFEKSLKKVRVIIPSLIALGIFLLVIQGILTALNHYFPTFSLFFRMISLLVDVLLMFAAMSIVIKRDPVEVSMFRSAHLVRKNFVTCLVFLILNNIVSICIMILGVFLSLPFLLPTFFDVVDYLKKYELIETFNLSILGDIVKLVKEHYLGFVGSMVVFSFFLSIQRVFDVASRTTLFLELMKRKSETF